MANSQYAYVRKFELPDALLPTSFLVLRIDGKGFHKFSAAHNFEKPNDKKALDLMNAAARRMMMGKELNGEIIIGFGESDEFSFLFKRSTSLYGRRASKLLTLVVSLFTTAYTFLWPLYFPNSPLELDNLPVFDGRIVQYTSDKEVKDYFRWRQVDTHINNMYNTCFWSLVLTGGLTEKEAHKELSQGTISSQKQELLFSRFGINYNKLPEMFKKGSTLIWEDVVEPEAVAEPITPPASSTSSSAVPPLPDLPELTTEVSLPAVEPAPTFRKKPTKLKRTVAVVHEDLIAEVWWKNGRGKGLLEL
ncbi:tRNA(His) guanylyltransferase [Pseudohyphozyma bogoriensis]|nr:tRNA(His) guanylyltransferase [Pseudohyphozyma bogoriensis]